MSGRQGSKSSLAEPASDMLSPRAAAWQCRRRTVDRFRPGGRRGEAPRGAPDPADGAARGGAESAVGGAPAWEHRGGLQHVDIIQRIRGPQPPSPLALKLIERFNRIAAENRTIKEPSS